MVSLTFTFPAAAWIALGRAVLLGLPTANFAIVSAMSSNFVQDVVLSDRLQRSDQLDENDSGLRSELMSHAILLKDYEAKLAAGGQRTQQRQSQVSPRGLQEDKGDDFYLSDDVMYSFSGYSLKYAQCQPVQYFSEDAIAAGEHSPMVIEDIVILRLCPQKSCSSSALYGCHYNYAEYALSMSMYLTIMLKYDAIRVEATCQWCEACQLGNNSENRSRSRKLEDGTDEDEEELDGVEAEEQDEADPAEEEMEQDNKAQQAADADDEAANDDVYDANLATYVANCPYYKTYCSNYNYDCNPDLADDAYVSYQDYEQVIESGYLNCAEVKYNNYAYYVRPRCDGYDGTIKMAVFYDQFCVQYAGTDLSIKNMGLGFHEDIFQEYYSSQCIECGVEDETSPPYFDMNAALCNKIHYTSAKCTADMSYNLFDGYQSSTSECSYIESIRFGTYDETGKLSSASVTSGVTWTTEVSTDQKIMLGFTVAVCIVLVFYACYIHHSMTNLLIKSLSHRELLPPSRHRSKSRRAGTTSNTRLGIGSNRTGNGDDDWEKPGIV